MDIDELEDGAIDVQKWTAIIPAAGIGSRLGYSKAKILYPIAGKTILEWIINSTEEICSRYVFVLSMQGKDQVEPYLKEIIPKRYKIVIQDHPTGMADAILLTECEVKTDYSLIIWGDQATTRISTLRKCAYSHTSKISYSLTMPTLVKVDPYINFIRDEKGKIIAVQQKRENEILEEKKGENDCGIFLFTNKFLFKILKDQRKNKSSYGKVTKEYNLLQVIPKFEHCAAGINTLTVTDASETLGINTVEDAALVERTLIGRIL